MRIAYFSDNFYPEISGISDSIITTGTELMNRGHEVVYVAPWYPNRAYKASRDTSRDRLNIIRLPSLYMPNSPTGQSRIALPIGSSLHALHRFKPDILHVQSPYGCGLEALLASKVLRVPIVGTNHTPLEEFLHYIPMGSQAWFKNLSFWYEKWFYNHCSFVTAPYQGLIDEMRMRGFTRPGKGLANPVPFAGSVKTPDQINACKLDLSITGPVILSSGRLAPEKKVDVMLRAHQLLLKKIPNATLVVTGHGSSEIGLKRLAEDLGITKHVRFVGFVRPEKLEELYCAAEAYVVMSTAETQSLSLMQAYANGVPAVAARARGLIDYVPETCGFLVEPDTVDDVAKKLELLLIDEHLHTRMSAAAAAFVSQFTTEAIATAWEGIYTDTMASRR